MPLPDHLAHTGHGVHCIDTGYGRPRFDAAWLVVDHGRAAFIDTGHNGAVPRLLGALDAVGLAPDAVDWVIPTHVHLDHAGGAGLLMSHLPAARLLVHPRGARHMVDPSALVAGAVAVYGEAEVARTHGTIVPVPAERVVHSHDEMTVAVGRRSLRLIDTPGHALHHHCVWDATSCGWFTGDTFGVAYPELAGPDGAFAFPSSTPVQFDPPRMRESMARMLAAEPTCVYVTHFGRVEQPHRLAQQINEQLDEIEAQAPAVHRAHPEAGPVREQALRGLVERITLQAARRAGCPLNDEATLARVASDMALNAQGLDVWLQRQTKTA